MSMLSPSLYSKPWESDIFAGIHRVEIKNLMHGMVQTELQDPTDELMPRRGAPGGGREERPHPLVVNCHEWLLIDSILVLQLSAYETVTKDCLTGECIATASVKISLQARAMGQPYCTGLMKTCLRRDMTICWSSST